MSYTKPWTPQEDQILNIIKSNRKTQKWKTISKIMQDEYLVFGRSAKECRQRWFSHFEPNINNQNWSEDEQKMLIFYHNEFGNRWTKIAHLIPGRSDNCIKNHFYCSLRKSVRKINRYLSRHKYKANFRQIKKSTLSKIIAVCDEKFEKKQGLKDRLILKCCDIKNRLLQYSKQRIVMEQIQEDIKQLILNIIDFSKCYKRRKNEKINNQIQENQISYNKKFDQNSNIKGDHEKKLDNITNIKNDELQNIVQQLPYLEILQSQKIQQWYFAPFQIQLLSPPDLIHSNDFDQDPLNHQYLQQIRVEKSISKITRNSSHEINRQYEPFEQNYQ